MRAALFDADGTLYSAQMGRGMVEYARSHGRRLRAMRYYASLLPRLILRRLGKGDSEDFQRALIEGLGGLIKGWDVAKGEQAFRWVAHDYLLSTRRADVLERLQEHQAQGHSVAIISGMLAPCLAVIGEELGVRDLIGTQVEIRAGVHTGRIVPPIIKGADKAKKTVEYFAGLGKDLDWSGSYAYGDSISDRGLLEMVGNPVAVYPDADLRALAQSRGWEILGI